MAQGEIRSENMEKVEELLVSKGLYDSVDITVDDLAELEKYLSKSKYAGNTIDCFCVHCVTNRVFEYADSEVHDSTGMVRMNIFDDVNAKARKPKKEEIFNSYLNRRYVLTYRCTRNKEHAILFDLIVSDDKIIKIGQYPSVADLVTPEIAKYKAILGKQYREFSKAVGLFAHGIGIGSFVYLRRIIENLVFDKYNQVADELGLSKEDFEHLKFDIKIETLKDYLPKVLVTNKNVYGIVSKGVHELSEEECREMFPYIKAGIELVLDDLLAEKERKEKEKVFEKFVAQKTGELKQ
jgi:hypothetical protein